ncbi:hypothetical protein DL771_008760 [Monosporascus sp. 5C6A]|nr:hypothetical protein DL771_008760 [Monosporascus sp. 5C6A]
MAPSGRISTRRATQIPREEWELWKGLIRTRYLIEGRELDELLGELHDLGFEVTKPQLEYKLSQWRFYKNLKADIWRYVGSTIQKRATALKESVVILSGQRLSGERVEYETRRNELVTLRPVPRASPPSEKIPVYICTPRGSSTDLAAGTPWGENLPWIQFCKSHLGTILENIQFSPMPGKSATRIITGPEPSFSLSQLARRELTMSKADRLALLPVVFKQISLRSMKFLMGSEELALQLFTKQSIDRIAAQFEVMMPEAYSGEHLQRATALVGGYPSELQTELLKLILYLASNNLPDARDDCYIDNAQSLISLSRLSGLADAQIIRNLVGLSRQSPTLTGVVDYLFQAAVNVQATDLVSRLLNADDRISADRRVQGCHPWKNFRVLDYCTPLTLAVRMGSVDLVTVLFPSLRHEMVQILLLNGATVNSSSPNNLSALQAAIMMGDTNLIEILIAKGADLNHRCNRSDELPVDFHQLEATLKLCLYSTVGSLDPWTQKLSPLRLATLSKYWDIAVLLVSSGATPTASDLWAAAKGGQLQLVEQLIEMGIHPDDAILDGVGAYEAALSHGHGLVAAKLFAAGATIGVEIYASTWRIPDVTCIRTILSEQLLQDTVIGTCKDGRSVLENAILRSGYIGLVKALLAHGADVNARRNRYATALEIASFTGGLDIVQLLLDSGACTEGYYGRDQYVRAILRATHGAVTELLRSFRKWTVEDQALYGELASFEFGSLFPREFSPGELIEVIAELDEDEPDREYWEGFRPTSWQRAIAIQIQHWVDVVVDANSTNRVDTLDDATRVAMQAVGMWDTEDPHGWAYHQGPFTPQLERLASEALRSWAADRAAGSADLELRAPESSTQPPSVDAGELDEDMPDAMPIDGEDTGGRATPTDTSVLDSHARGLGHEVFDENWEETRQTAFRQDMLGEVEAPFVPMTWQL